MDAMRTTLALSIDRRLLMSCCYLVLDADAGQLSYANAGHPPPLLLRAQGGPVEELPAIDPLLGVLDAELQPLFGQHSLPWASGDLLFVYSDGVTEARGPQLTMFGYERLRQCVASCTGLGAQGALNTVLDAVAGFGEGEPVGDDLTLVVARAK
jgi:sigma-B regulation protein RsbU (phosphoserine phosphatase)